MPASEHQRLADDDHQILPSARVALADLGVAALDEQPPPTSTAAHGRRSARISDARAIGQYWPYVRTLAACHAPA